MTDAVRTGPAPAKPRNLALVVIWMAGALLSFSAAALGVRGLSRTLSIFELLALRNEAGLLILVVAAAIHPAWRAGFRPARPGLQLVRNVVHFGAQYLWATGVTLLPLATVFALEFTAPVWLAALAILILGERLTVSRAGAIVLGLAGALIILRPGHEAFQPAALVVLVAALGFAATAVATRALTRSVSTFSILFWMNAVQLVLNLAGSDPLFWGRVEASQLPGVAMLALGGLLSHLCLTQAYRHGDAILVMPLDFLRIPVIAIVGWRFYGEPLDPYVFLGAGIVVTGILWNLTSEARTGPALSPSRRPGPGPAS